jgi:hypothetical protein
MAFFHNSFRIAIAATEQGIFRSHLREMLEYLQNDPQLENNYKRVLGSDKPLLLEPKIRFELHSLGLVEIVRNDCIPSCELYRQYFLSC